MSQFCRVAAVAAFVVFAFSPSQAKSDSWIEVRSSNFIVVSNAGEKQARKAALQCEQIRAVFRQSLPIADAHPSPLVTVFAAKNEATMHELLPEYWARGRAHPAGLFAYRLNYQFAAVELDARGSNAYQTFYHEYYHSITMPYFPELPVWLSEGLAEFYGHTDIEEKYTDLGQLDEHLIEVLGHGRFIPLDLLFKVDQKSSYYNEANQTSMFYAESWALTHYLMLGDGQAHRAQLMAYLNAFEQRKTPDEAAALAFGDLQKLQSELENYVHYRKFFPLKIVTPKVDESEPKIKLLSEAEADAYRGGFAAVRGQTQQATATLREALRLDSNVALAHQFLGMVQFEEGQSEKALESASRAVALDPGNYFSHYLRAFLVTSGPGTTSGDPSVEEDLRRAIALNPEFSPPYALLAVYLAAGKQNLDEALALAQKAISFEPGSSSYQLSLAQVLLRMNKFPEASLALIRASAWARDSQEKQNAESVKSYVQPLLQLQGKLHSVNNGDLENAQSAPVPASPNVSAGSSPSRPRSTGLHATTLHLQANLTLMGSPSGVDLQPYVNDIIPGLRDKLLASLAPLSFSQPGTLSLEFVVLTDGSVDGVKVVSSSGDAPLDQSLGNALAAASPLQTLPPGLVDQSIQLRLNLSYSREVSDF